MLKDEIKLMIKSEEVGPLTASSDSDNIESQCPPSDTDNIESQCPPSDTDNIAESGDIEKETHSAFWECFDEMLQNKS